MELWVVSRTEFLARFRDVFLGTRRGDSGVREPGVLRARPPRTFLAGRSVHSRYGNDPAETGFCLGDRQRDGEPALGIFCRLSCAYQALSRPVRPISLSLSAAGLAATRPEWTPLAGLVPLALLLPGSGHRLRLRDALVGYVVFSLVILAVFGILRFSTGLWQPSAEMVPVSTCTFGGLQSR